LAKVGKDPISSLPGRVSEKNTGKKKKANRKEVECWSSGHMATVELGLKKPSLDLIGKETQLRERESNKNEGVQGALFQGHKLARGN